MEEYKELLIQSVADVLERFAFMFVEPSGMDEVPAPEEEFREASLSFTGPRKGQVFLAAPESFCIHLAANVLGLEEGNITDEAGNDALKELLNVIVGEYLEKSAGREPVFDLSIPEISRQPAQAWAERAESPDWTALLADEGPVLVRLEDI